MKAKIPYRYEAMHLEPYYEAYLEDRLYEMEGVTDEVIYDLELYIDELLQKEGEEALYVLSFDEYHGSVPETHKKRVFERKQVLLFHRMFVTNFLLTIVITFFTIVKDIKSAGAVFLGGLIFSALSVFLTTLFLTKFRDEEGDQDEQEI